MSEKNSATERQPMLSVAAVLAGVPLCVPGLLVGAALIQNLSLLEGVLAAMVGCVALTIYAGLTGSLGASTGLSTSQLLQGPFGAVGRKIVSGAIGVCLAGWYAVQTGMFGQTINTLFPTGGILTSVEGASLWGGLLMLTSALFGMRGLAKLSVIAVPAIVVLTLWALVQLPTSPELWASKPSVPGAFGSAVSMVIGSFAIGATVNPDITRFCRNTTHSWLVTLIGFFVVSMYIFCCGAITAKATGSGDLIAAMLNLGLGAFAFITLVLSQWTTNDNNIFYASESLGSVFPKMRRAHLVLVFGGVATLAGVLGIANSFPSFLLMLGVTIPPVGGVMVAHYAIARRRGVSSTAAVSVPVPAFAGLIIGAVAGKFIDIGIPAINGMLAAAIVYMTTRSIFNGHYADTPLSE
jgi:cytosine permease